MTLKNLKLINYSLLNNFDIEQFRNQKPFPYKQIKGFIKEEKYHKLRKELPNKQLFSEQKGNRRRYGQASHDRLSLDFKLSEAISKNWREFIDEIETGPYYEFVSNVLGTNKFQFKYHWHYTPSAASVSPHCDAEWKLGSHILIFYIL